MNAVNDAPVAVDDAIATDEDSLIFTPVTGNLITGTGQASADSDIDGDALAITAINGDPSLVGQAIALGDGISVTITSDGSFTLRAANPVAVNALEGSEVGGGSIVYSVSDGDITDTAAASFAVQGADDNGIAKNGRTNGTNGRDFIDGLAGNDKIYLLDGDDFVYGGQGNDKLYGGNGIDTAFYSGSYDDYDVDIKPNSVHIRDLAGDEGNDVLYDVEFAHFLGSNELLDLSNGNLFAL